jgi:predicted nuclease with RNAse H fold
MIASHACAYEGVSLIELYPSRLVSHLGLLLRWTQLVYHSRLHIPTNHDHQAIVCTLIALSFWSPVAVMQLLNNSD